MTLSGEQLEIWKNEEKYWEYFTKGDGEGFLSLWAEDFHGWPSSCLTGEFETEQIDYQYVADVLAPAVATITEGEHELSDISVVVAGRRYGVALYTSEFSVTGAYGPMKGLERYTHTWRKEKNGEMWKIVSGMSAVFTVERTSQLVVTTMEELKEIRNKDK